MIIEPVVRQLPQEQREAIERAIDRGDTEAVRAFAEQFASKWFTAPEALFAADHALLKGHIPSIVALSRQGIVSDVDMLVRVAKALPPGDFTAEERRIHVRTALDAAGPTWRFRRLMEALRTTNPAASVATLQECGLDVNDPGFPRRPLVAAVTHGSLETCKVLVEAGADILEENGFAVREAERVGRAHVTEYLQGAWIRASSAAETNARSARFALR